MSNEPVKIDEEQIINRPTAPVSRSEREEREALRSLSRPQAKVQLSMKVRVYSPFRTYYDGPAFSVSAENATGPFDILPKHHNFISLLLPCDLILRTVSKGDQKFSISGGIMHVKADQVIIFLDV